MGAQPGDRTLPAAPLPPDEAERLQALHTLDVLRDAPPEGMIRAARLAQTMFASAAAAVCFVSEDTLHYKVTLGVELPNGLSRRLSFSNHALHADGVFWVEDARTDPRVSDLVATAPIAIGFYAGAALRDQGQAVGVLCVSSAEPRAYDARLAQGLEDLAGLLSSKLALRRSLVEAAAARTARRSAERVSGAYVAHAPVALVMLDRDLRYLMPARAGPRTIAWGISR